ncbi:MAG: hypothetical protein ACI82F_001392 [Planctomycetota bacterium]|jgi:hypothetical protein
MNRLLTSALALTALGAIGHAANGGEDDWLELDSEINGLATSVSTQGDWMNIKALLRGFYNYSGDDLATFVGNVDTDADMIPDTPLFGDDVSGVSLEDAEINGNFQVGDFKLRLGIDFRSGNSELQDAFGMYHVNPDVSVRMGRYKPHVLRSNFTDPDKLFFPYRTALGAAFDFYDEGIGAFGDVDAISWSLDVLNGPATNGNRSGHLYIMRVLWNFGRLAGQYETTPEDAFGAGSEPAFTVGATIVENDVDKGDASAIGIDAQGTVGRIGFGAEVMRVGEDMDMVTQKSGWQSIASPLSFSDGDDSTTPWSVQGNIMPSDRFGFGARIEDLDNANDETIFTLAANMYDAGHAGKLTAAVSFISTDASFGGTDYDDSTVFTLGYTFGASR